MNQSINQFDDVLSDSSLRLFLQSATLRGLLCSLIVCAHQAAMAQDSSAPPSTSSELVQGLLELLNEPNSSAPPEDAKTRSMQPADIGSQGEDLGQASENPLVAVKQSMLIAAGQLRRDAAIPETLKLQGDIVRRLDEMISALEQSQSKQDKFKQAAKQSSKQSASAQLRAQAEQSAKRRSQALREQAPEPSEAGQEPSDSAPPGGLENSPLQRMTANGTSVDLSDPKALQQDVWGQLPARVRQQMQSRMVEQFLPAYREQIEAYFQALLK